MSFFVFQHAWSVAILLEDKLHCSASLISDRQIVTAAHCFFNKAIRFDDSKFTLVFGASDPTDQANVIKRGGKFRSISKVHINPSFDKKSAYFDVAIVELSEPIQNFQKNIWPICLPDSPMKDIDHLFDKTGRVVAFGSNPNDNQVLSEIFLTVRDKDFCNLKYYVSPIDEKFTEILKKLPDLFNNPAIFCAQFEGTNFGTCRGDSGMQYINVCLVMEFFY